MSVILKKRIRQLPMFERFHNADTVVNKTVIVFWGIYLLTFVSTVFAQEELPQELVLSNENVTSSVTENKKSTSFLESEKKTPIKESEPKSSEIGERRNSYLGSWITGIGALALVLGTFLGGVYCLKLLVPNRFSGKSPLITVLDSCFIGRKTELVTVHWGTKLLLIAFASGCKPIQISEITDPKEVETLLDLMRETKNSGKVKSKVFSLKKLMGENINE